MLRTALGSSSASWIDDPTLFDVMLNPDSRLSHDRLGDEINDTGELLTAVNGERIVRLVAHYAVALRNGVAMTRRTLGNSCARRPTEKPRKTVLPPPLSDKSRQGYKEGRRSGANYIILIASRTKLHYGL